MHEHFEQEDHHRPVYKFKGSTSLLGSVENVKFKIQFDRYFGFTKWSAARSIHTTK